MFFKTEGAGVDSSARGCLTGEIDRTGEVSASKEIAMLLTELLDAEAGEPRPSNRALEAFGN